MEFDFYYGSQADQFSFIKIPRVMITDEMFAALSIQAKMLYSVLLDRMTLSRKNRWFDEENRVFIIYPITEIQSDLGFSKKKAMEYLSELEQFGLLMKKKRGFGQPSIIYVKSFLVQQSHSRSAETGTTEISRGANYGTSDAVDSIVRGVEMGTSEVPESTPLEVTKLVLQEVPESEALISKTDKNKTDRNHIESNHIVSCDEMRWDKNAEVEQYSELIRKNIGYEFLLLAHPDDRELLQGIFQLILETIMIQNETILIASENYLAELVKSKFLKLEYAHIEYVIRCFKGNTTKVRNIKKYLLAALFNAPATMEGYYQAEVTHAMPQLAQ